LKDLGFEYIELEGVGSENLLEVVHHKRDFLELFESLGVRISNFAVILPEIISMDRSVKERAIELFETGVKTARYLRSDYLWIDSYMPPVEVKEGKALSQSLEFGTEMKVKIPAGFSWSDFWENFVDSVKKCNRIAEKNGVQLLMEPRTGEVVSNSDALLRILEAVGSENFEKRFFLCRLRNWERILNTCTSPIMMGEVTGTWSPGTGPLTGKKYLFR
jgi:sugar phosphate isomerase/epimerase